METGYLAIWYPYYEVGFQGFCYLIQGDAWFHCVAPPA
jgi:hypothetical protein